MTRTLIKTQTGSAGITPVSGNCSGSTVNFVAGYRRWSGGDFLIPSATYTGALGSAGFYNTTEAVSSGIGYRYFYADPANPSRIYVSDSAPSSANTRTISSTVVVYIVALRMTSNSAYTSQVFSKNIVNFNTTTSVFPLTSIQGLQLFHAASNSSNTQTINPVTDANKYLPSTTVLESTEFSHYASWQQVSTNAGYVGAEMNFRIGSTQFFYQEQVVMNSNSTSSYAFTFLSKVYTLHEATNTHNQTLTWAKATNGTANLTGDANHIHSATILNFKDKLMVY